MAQTLSAFRTAAGAAEYAAAYRRTLALWPPGVQSVEVHTRFGFTHVNTFGDSALPPLILVHGFGFSSTQWYPNVQALAGHFHIFAPDVPDQFGLSRLESPLQSRANYGQWLAEVLDGLGHEWATVVGHSYGGWISTTFAVAFPERVDKLALIAPAATFVRLGLQFMVRGIFGGMASGMLNIDWPVYSMVKWMTTLRPVRGLDVVEQFKIGMKNMKPVPAGMPDVFTAAELARLTMPVLLLIGKHEVIYARRVSRVVDEANRLLPSMQTVMVPAGGHAVNLDQPEAVNRALVEFLRPA